MGKNNSKPAPAKSLPKAPSRQTSRARRSATFIRMARASIEDRLAAAIQAKARSGAIRKISFNRLLLSFPSTLHRGFAKCRALFRELDTTGAGELVWADLADGCRRLGYTLDDDVLEGVFLSVHGDEGHALNADETVAALCLCHVLKGPDDAERVDPDILAAFKAAEEAFLAFDSSADGYVSKEELGLMMTESHTNHLRRQSASSPGAKGGSGKGGAAAESPHPIEKIVAARFAELDQDGDGKVAFSEFLFALESWVEDAED